MLQAKTTQKCSKLLTSKKERVLGLRRFWRGRFWRPILPNQKLAKVNGFEQTVGDDPAKFSEIFIDVWHVCSAKMHDA